MRVTVSPSEDFIEKKRNEAIIEEKMNIFFVTVTMNVQVS